MTRACFEPASFFCSGAVMAGCAGFAVVARAAVDLGERFFEDFGIGILPSVYGRVLRRPTTEAPPRPTSRRGRIPGALMIPGLDDSTAPIADECHSFLDNVVAQFGRRRAGNDRRGCPLLAAPIRECRTSNPTNPAT